MVFGSVPIVNMNGKQESDIGLSGEWVVQYVIVVVCIQTEETHLQLCIHNGLRNIKETRLKYMQQVVRDFSGSVLIANMNGKQPLQREASVHFAQDTQACIQMVGMLFQLLTQNWLRSV